MRLSDRIGRRLKLQDLNVLMTAVQAGSMGRAARVLNTTQPNISRAIADLEHELGVRLVDRHHQGIAPTEYGRALLDCGAAVFEDLRQGVKKIEFLSDPAAGEIRIGSSTFIGQTFVSAVIKRILRRHPRILFHLVTADETETLHRELSDRKVDLLITRRVSLFADNKKFGFEILYNSPFVVVAEVRSPWVRRRSIALTELMNESWLLPPPEAVLGPVYQQVFHANGVDYPRAAIFAAPPDIRLSLLASGRFVTIVPKSVLRLAKSRRIKILPVTLQQHRVPSGIVTLSNRTISPVSQVFVDAAREFAETLA